MFAAGVVGVLSGRLGDGGHRPAGSPGPAPAAQAGVGGVVGHFFASYVERSGQVVRWDQGGDTVSEGQAYALLLSVAAGDRSRFYAVWEWTRSHLQRPDGLLAWHWAGGNVADEMPAADADLDAAWALDLADARFGDASLGAQARRIAASILSQETVATALGPVLVAGPWARGAPALVEPGYDSPEAFASLERFTGDPRWQELGTSSAAIVARLTGDAPPAGSRLLPDWASVSSTGAVAPAAAPGSSGSPAFGLDAARAVVWDAACTATAPLAAREWAPLSVTAEHGYFPVKLSLAGRPETASLNPLTAVADAAAAGASGRHSQERSLLDAASHLSARYPTYYGSAWVALADSLLKSAVLGGCPGLTQPAPLPR